MKFFVSLILLSGLHLAVAAPVAAPVEHLETIGSTEEKRQTPDDGSYIYFKDKRQTPDDGSYIYFKDKRQTPDDGSYIYFKDKRQTPDDGSYVYFKDK